ncbi:hypothetical protein ACIBI7_51610 [Nonomuraea fuscirosea]|uniref:hypothetical protein n=1 Tax=Nonomuraea fuscirosea TaxID=1291556 RepID=UPI00379BADC1
MRTARKTNLIMPGLGYEIASMWAKLPSDHLSVALAALEPELKREHAYRLATLKDAADRRTHVLHMTGLIAGFGIALAMLGAAVWLGINNQPWLAALMAGPSIIAIIKILVLRRSGPDDIKDVGKAQSKVQPL